MNESSIRIRKSYGKLSNRQSDRGILEALMGNARTAYAELANNLASVRGRFTFE